MIAITLLSTLAFGQGYGDEVLIEDLWVLPELLNEVDVDEVVGGTKIDHDRWDDAAGIVFYNSYVGCTGTLIAPDVVLTAGHCDSGISHVVLGSNDWYSNEGEMIPVENSWEYKDSWRSYDIAVLKLDSESSIEPRPLALDCIIDEYLHDGVEVAVVGFGNTNEQGNKSTSQKREGFTHIQDHDCDENYINGVYAGCNSSVSPGGELGAGGDGVDACFGDSGGPLYLITDKGDYLVGVTSRAYAGVSQQYPCRDGGIYVRPDAVVKWIERKSGRTLPRPACNAAPDPEAADIAIVAKDESGTTQIFPNDPDPDNIHTFTLAEAAENGDVQVFDDGTVVYTPHKGFSGTDRFTVAVTDDGSDYKSSGPITADVDIDVTVERMGGSGGGCGCSSTEGFAGGLWLTLTVGFLVRRRN
ncbi:MAG: trypsin-like serine protease [Proteobacteria bacterium]|jgi:secreted trypsin-like serine protease|nr:trypsin-like serine protease [Pseudomonadota bacterium]